MFFLIFWPPVPRFKATMLWILYYEPLRFDPHPLEFFLREQMPQNPTLPFSRFELYFSAIVPNIFFQPLGGVRLILLTCRISVSGISSYRRHMRLAICSTGARHLRKTAVWEPSYAIFRSKTQPFGPFEEIWNSTFSFFLFWAKTAIPFFWSVPFDDLVFFS